MVITCPSCDTQFNLANTQYSPGRKARCSVCSHTFILPAMVMSDEDEDIPNAQTTPEPDVSADNGASATSLPDELESGGDAEPPVTDEPAEKTAKKDKKGKKPGKKAKKKSGALKKFLLFLAVLLCLAGLGLGAYIVYFQNFSITLPTVDPVAERISNIDKVRDLPLIDVQHKYVQNVKLGPLVVITGKVRNNFSTPKEKIRVEAALLDKDGKVLAVQQQYCGIVVPEIQLQILGQKELAQALDNRFEMLANNINVMPGIEVPFMVVFVYPPSNMAEYTVMVSDVSDPPSLAPGTGQ